MKLDHIHHPKLRGTSTHVPLHTYNECALAISLSSYQLNALRRLIVKVPFPPPVFVHNATRTAPHRAYYRLSEVRTWKERVDAERLTKLAVTHWYVRAGLLAELVGEPL